MTTTDYSWMRPDLIPSPERIEQMRAVVAAFKPIQASVIDYIVTHRTTIEDYVEWVEGLEGRPDEHFDFCDELIGYGPFHRSVQALGQLLEYLVENKIEDYQLEGWDA